MFGLFNKKIRDENRTKFLVIVEELFDLESKGLTRFDSISVLNPINATYYLFSDERNDGDIDGLTDCENVSIVRHLMKYSMVKLCA